MTVSSVFKGTVESVELYCRLHSTVSSSSIKEELNLKTPISRFVSVAFGSTAEISGRGNGHEPPIVQNVRAVPYLW